MAQPAVKKFEYQIATAVENLIACGVILERGIKCIFI